MKWKHWTTLVIICNILVLGVGDCQWRKQADERLDRIERMLEDVRYE